MQQSHGLFAIAKLLVCPGHSVYRLNKAGLKKRKHFSIAVSDFVRLLSSISRFAADSQPREIQLDEPGLVRLSSISDNMLLDSFQRAHFAGLHDSVNSFKVQNLFVV